MWIKNLRKLNVAGQGLSFLPETLQALKGLRVLDVSENRLEEVPDWLYDMRSLLELHLDHNRIQHISGPGAVHRAIRQGRDGRGAVEVDWAPGRWIGSPLDWGEVELQTLKRTKTELKTLRLLFNTTDKKDANGAVDRIELIQDLRAIPEFTDLLSLPRGFSQGSSDHTRFEAFFQRLEILVSPNIAWEAFLKANPNPNPNPLTP